MAGAPEHKGLRASLALAGSRRFGPFLAFSFLSNIGTWVQLVAEPWLLLNLSGSSFLVGLDSFLMNGPILLLIFLGGILADRRDRRRVILFFQTIQMLCPLALVLLILRGQLTPWWIVGLSLVVGITDALSMPAFQSIVPLIVEREQVGTAVALNSAVFNLSRVVGPALGGWLMAVHGPIACFGLNVLSYVPFVGAAYWVLPRTAPAKPAEKSVPVLRASLGSWRNPRMRGALLAVAVMSLFCGPLLAFSSVLVRSALHADVSDFGNSMAAFGFGGLFGAALVLALDERFDPRHICSLALVLYGVLLTATGLIPSPGVLQAFMAVAGALMAIGTITANSVLQRTASRESLGQAAGLFMLCMRGGLAVGNLLAGLLVARWGVVTILTVSGAMAVALQATNFLLWE